MNNKLNKVARKIKLNSITNCPQCGKKKIKEFVGECWECTYPEELNETCVKKV